MAALLFSLAVVALAFGLAGLYFGKTLNPTTIGNLVAALALATLAAAESLKAVQQRRVGHARKIWTRATLHAMAAVVLTALVLVAASRLRVRWDLTQPRSYTLSDFTLQVLRDLPLEIEAIYLGGNDAFNQERLLLEQFAKASPKFHLRVLAPQQIRGRAAREMTFGGSPLMLRAGGRTRKVPAISERYIVQGILEFSARRQRGLCFLTGHGEFSPARQGARGLSTFRTMLDREGFGVSDLPLAARAEVPEDCDIVVVAAPERHLLAEELDRLQGFLDRGGRLLVFAEPDRPLEPASQLAALGISAREGVVVDEEASLLGSAAPGIEILLNRFPSYHPVARGLNDRTGVVFSGTRALTLSGQEPRGFVFSDRTSRLEPVTEMERMEHASAGRSTAGKDRPKGPFPLAATVEKPTGKNGRQARVVVFGDTDFATNHLIGVLYNEDLVMNAVYYLANWDDRIHLRPKVEDLYQVPLVPEKTLSAFHSLALVVPEVILVLGLLVWFRRRRL